MEPLIVYPKAFHIDSLALKSRWLDNVFSHLRGVTTHADSGIIEVKQFDLFQEEIRF